MEEQNLLKTALICSLTGLLILLFIMESIEIKQYKIKDINKKLIDKDIQVQGTITRITETPGLIIFDLNDKTGTITIILFKEEPINLTKNMEINIAGTVAEYKNKLEIIADEISSI